MFICFVKKTALPRDRRSNTSARLSTYKVERHIINAVVVKIQAYTKNTILTPYFAIRTGRTVAQQVEVFHKLVECASLGYHDYIVIKTYGV